MTQEEIARKLLGLVNGRVPANEEDWGLLEREMEKYRIIATWHLREVERIVAPLVHFKNNPVTIEAMKSYAYCIKVDRAMDETLKLAGKGEA